jgi:hypothetical protein
MLCRELPFHSLFSLSSLRYSLSFSFSSGKSVSIFLITLNLMSSIVSSGNLNTHIFISNLFCNFLRICFSMLKAPSPSIISNPSLNSTTFARIWSLGIFKLFSR